MCGSQKKSGFFSSFVMQYSPDGVFDVGTGILASSNAIDSFDWHFLVRNYSQNQIKSKMNNWIDQLKVEMKTNKKWKWKKAMKSDAIKKNYNCNSL